MDTGRVEALLFDLGGVVIDIDFGRAIQHWAAAAGREVAEVGERFSMDLAYEAHERGELDGAAYLAALRTTLALDLDDEQLLAGWNAIFLGPVPGMRELLSAAAETLPLYLFSNSNTLHQAHWATQYAEELTPFRALFVSSELGLRKPSAESFHEVARRIGVDPAAILFFDDTESNVLGAREAGLQAVLFGGTADAAAALAALGVVVER